MTDDSCPQHDKVYQIKGSCCRYCGSPATGLTHYLPMEEGGTEEISNLEPACDDCRAAKADHVPHPWTGHPYKRWWIPGHPMNPKCRDYYGI